MMKSFTSVIKAELCKLPLKDNCCAAAELLGVICYSSFLKNNSINVRVENISVAKRIFSLTKIITGNIPEIFKDKYNDKFINTIKIAQNEDVANLLNKFGLVKCNMEGKSFILFSVKERFVSNRCCKQAFLRGAFLVAGSCMNPDRQYHLELSTRHRHLHKDTENIIKELDMNPKLLNRNGVYTLYFKNSESIFDFLGNIGATKCMLDYQNVRILREISNNMNRAINCEEANRRKTELACDEQLDAIEKIEKHMGLDTLENSLREICYLRMDYPDYSLSELSLITKDKISKASLSRKLKKIIEIADKLEKKE